MKKLISVLLMLSLLCTAAAAVAETPSVELSLSMGRGSCRAIVRDGNVEFSYYIGGSLECYTYVFDCGCSVTFSPDGVINYDNVMRRIDGSTYHWNRWKNAWVKYAAGPGSEIMKTDTTHLFVESAHKAPLTEAETNAMPPSNIDNFEEIKKQVTESFPLSVSVLTDIPGVIIPQLPGATSGSLVLVEIGDMYALYRYSESTDVYNLVEVYADKYFINVLDNEVDMRMQGNAKYGTYTEGFYDWETGKLFQYKFYTQDRSANAVYSNKNVMLSQETWDADGGWWGFFNNAWEYAADGNPDNATVVAPKNVPSAILEQVLHAPGPATYDSACVPNVSDLKPDEKGVPFILAAPSAINNATVRTTAEQTGERTTKFDIKLVNADGKKVDLAASSVSLTLGYPAGMPQDIAKNYEFAVIHETDDGAREVMTTLTNNVTLTPNGPQVTATSFSPYTVIWGTADELADLAAEAAASLPNTDSLPTTGDSSALFVWAALLVISTAAIFARKRSRA